MFPDGLMDVLIPPFAPPTVGVEPDPVPVVVEPREPLVETPGDVPTPPPAALPDEPALPCAKAPVTENASARPIVAAASFINRSFTSLKTLEQVPNAAIVLMLSRTMR